MIGVYVRIRAACKECGVVVYSDYATTFEMAQTMLTSAERIAGAHKCPFNPDDDEVSDQ